MPHVDFVELKLPPAPEACRRITINYMSFSFHRIHVIYYYWCPLNKHLRHSSPDCNKRKYLFMCFGITNPYTPCGRIANPPEQELEQGQTALCGAWPVLSWRNSSTTTGKLQYYHGGTGCTPPRRDVRSMREVCSGLGEGNSLANVARAHEEKPCYARVAWFDGLPAAV